MPCLNSSDTSVWVCPPFMGMTNAVQQSGKQRERLQARSPQRPRKGLSPEKLEESLRDGTGEEEKVVSSGS